MIFSKPIRVKNTHVPAKKKTKFKIFRINPVCSKRIEFKQKKVQHAERIIRRIPPAIQSVFSLFINLAGGNINLSFFLALFFLTAAIFRIFSLAGWIITKNKLWSIFLGFVGTLTPLSIHLPAVFSSLENFLTLFVKNF